MSFLRGGEGWVKGSESKTCTSRTPFTEYLRKCVNEKRQL